MANEASSTTNPAGTEEAPLAVCSFAFVAQAKCAKHGSPLSGLFVITRCEGPKDRPVTPAAQESYSIYMADEQGYLQPAPDENPWQAFYTNTWPHSQKFSAYQRYRGCLIRHPNAEMVRAFAEYLNSGVDTAGYGFGRWGEPADLVRELNFEPEPGNDGTQPILWVEEDPKLFLPPGPELYGGWTLYRDMPNAACEVVAKQVERLQCHLGALRYPIGRQEYPYWPEPRTNSEDTDRNAGIFDGRTQAAVARFQEHASEGRAARVLNLQETHGRHVQLRAPFMPKSGDGGSWAYVVAEDAAPAGAGKIGRHTLGVVDADTASAIANWLADGLRKPGRILLEIPIQHSGGGIWLREEAAGAVQGWRAIVRAFGVRYGLASAHSFRNILNKTLGKGTRLNSIHKTGLAIDFRSLNYTDMRPEWPIRFEANWWKDNPQLRRARKDLDTALRKEAAAYDAFLRAKAGSKAEERARKSWEKSFDTAKEREEDVKRLEKEDAEDETQTKRTFRLNWRLYGHSDLPVYDKNQEELPEAPLETLRRALDEVPARLEVELLGRLGGRPTDPAAAVAWEARVRTWMADIVAPVEAAVRELQNLPDEEILPSYFRDRLKQWLFNGFQPDGGESKADPIDPSYSDSQFPPPSDFEPRSFVNLSALGAKCKMVRIGALRSGAWKDQSTMKKKAVTTMLLVRKRLADIVTNIKAMLAPGSVHAQTPIVFPRGKDNTLWPEILPDAVDLDFLERWKDACPSFRSRKFQKYVVLDPPQVTVQIDGSPKGKPVLESFLDTLEQDFGPASFLIDEAGTRTGLEAGSLTTGTLVGVALRTALAEFEAELALEQSEREAARKEKRKPRPSTKRDQRDWKVRLQPVFNEVSGDPKTEVLFLPKDTPLIPSPGDPQALEWWHYQHEVAYGKSWGDLLAEIGFSAAVLGAPWIPEESGSFYGRGIGYTTEELDDSSGGAPASTVENFSESMPHGG